MSSLAFVSVVNPDRTVKAPPGVAIGAHVLVVPMPSLAELFHDAARRARFATTRRTIHEVMQAGTDAPALSDEAIVSLVHRGTRRQLPGREDHKGAAISLGGSG